MAAPGCPPPGPGRPLIPTAAALAGAGAVLAVHNVGIERLPGWLYVPANLASSGAVLALAAAAGVSASGLGLPPHRARAGLAAGGAVGLGAALVVVGAGCHPATRPLFADKRMAGVGPLATAYRAAVRIPLGTVVLEEVTFRGVLPALLGRLMPPRRAVAAASLAFGVWHLVPTAAALDLNGVASGVRARALALAGAVACTAVAGAGLCRLRLATGSLLAPALVHASATATATLVAGIAIDCAKLHPRGPRGATLHSRRP